ncbi:MULTISPECIES: bifunctional 2-C-methyl-D-erythritol 4-phosphate cytidylyltransferase/2-C-methyl-D-erythritol 2,4-cyclodiphosphate synthase [unclassified Sphingomonas]|uniref:bifunctional 2-C-methyl-D-erythritol 4-phosphate cytidylyltransferase/2-C-methyl-D-erythritol 2,4-cyclodiphosphate synthase n=1 Tax=Sphingomonas TaxID=13687 RepID=UPI00095C4CE4|nr:MULTISPECIES: bifunctional 2-C-methyl-D-erythritol 4-phosphate cytidylyltransferase/2-C-methyl-D-erythritol 2,4-cyclodiphosphate synthase [unclassified Sphingomonas]MBN8813238.1 bifunctional 2-C-methyl-D-erythritol 4-phosphate cytidylyltransferase/2-C-methyl-D-erythritol 2,4-cyclodiphosphate synthase [Sphingomonas sp.]OJY53439.1 MAG: bifunctional 2-C-methyl-D-erythritol 4-phosphate cytidylyltransferase/2-C-methyl-D-erythritol 2,4-cyclodiphosphate synthase [Sphingomonas sp. 67-41]
MKTVAILVAAGSGTRAGGRVPKQFAPLAGKPMLKHGFDALTSHPEVDAVYVVIGAGQEEALRAALGDVPFAIGGATRRESVASGLAALGEADRVLIHDAARPFLPRAVIDRLLAALETHDGAIPGLPVADTLVAASGASVPRDGLVRVQTPQAFRYAAIAQAHVAWPGDQEATDDAQMLRALGMDVAIVEGSPMLEKITHPADFAAAEARHGAAMRVRTATGYDVHRFAEGEELWLGGVRVPHARGLSGHSDADVALHAITDALLGTIGAGDIGMHFPPSDPQWRGQRSSKFLEHAAALVAAKGGVIDFIDLTIICEAPKIGPHREAIRASIAGILGLEPSEVSVKATTTERLGFTGRGEGMAAQAIATVRVPG